MGRHDAYIDRQAYGLKGQARGASPVGVRRRLDPVARYAFCGTRAMLSW